MSGLNFSLTDKVVLITGGARGLGAAISAACASLGARIYLQDINREGVEETAAGFRAQGFSVETDSFDLTDFEACKTWVQSVHRSAGSIWGLVNNAGITNHGHVLDQSVDDYQSIYNLHVFAPFVMAKEAASAMLENEGPQRGRIVSLSSIAATHPRPGIGNYASSKAAVAGLTRSLAADFGPNGICANAIAPGYVLTEMNKKILSNEGFVKRIENRTPTARWADPAEIAAPVAFLMSQAASYINGQLIAVDGGMNAFLQSNEG